MNKTVDFRNVANKSGLRDESSKSKITIDQNKAKKSNAKAKKSSNPFGHNYGEMKENDSKSSNLARKFVLSNLTYVYFNTGEPQNSTLTSKYLCNNRAKSKVKIEPDLNIESLPIMDELDQ